MMQVLELVNSRPKELVESDCDVDPVSGLAVQDLKELVVKDKEGRSTLITDLGTKFC
jgi:hypothetical protein